MSTFVARRSRRIEQLTRLASQSDLYPPEIWEHIFRHLTGLQILRTRLVCRRWRDIIAGCPLLLRKLRIRFDNRRYRELVDDFPLLPITEASILEYSVVVAPDWWPWVSQKLTHLTLFDCGVKVSLLLGMLQQTSNLRCLKIRECFLEGIAEPNVQFPQLEELTLDKVEYDHYDDNEYTNLLDIFEKIFPRLRDLRIRKIGENGFNVERLVPAIRALASTLDALEMDFAGVNVLRDLPELTRTRLRRISVHVDPYFELDRWSRFFRAQPLLDDLVIFTTNLATNMMVCDIGRAVSNLKRLKLHVTNTFSTDFLEFMPNLEYFELHGEVFEDILLYKRGSPRLTELHLRDVEVNGFWPFLNLSPLLRRIVLHGCTLNFQTSNVRVLRNIRTLEIDEDSNVPLKMLKALLRKCPSLEEFSFGCAEDYPDSVPLLICERLKRLRKLSLRGYPVTDASVNHIVQHGRALEEVRLNAYVLSEETIERLLANSNLQVWLDQY
ncbi:uncharacterized protein LOC6045626 [Culex quinquefasciatus]|uniref:uncharacterized protein LOC6045626 n=1 Tax=Culex quinquefasciatus TaxID=7176 RepID=UPI0018E3C7C5|nr:uncharacterized protein LOC6045626 [Culex quinquefasciatus]XP_038104676.1 uncharacterized protein LOC6045626 [Culex quinquefasciatus]